MLKTHQLLLRFGHYLLYFYIFYPRTQASWPQVKSDGRQGEGTGKASFQTLQSKDYQDRGNPFMRDESETKDNY